MALTFGAALDDVSADDDELSALLGDANEDDPSYEADPEPGWDEPQPTKLGEKITAKIRTTAARPVRVTAAVRKDVRGKTAMLLMLGARTWAARDEICGSAALEAVPDVSAALADILCDSPDIVRWFSAGTGYMKWLNLAMALQPVGEAVWSHHIAHSIDDAGREQDWSAYVA